eukprot:CAMPEP_0184699832 /NCGR_PEP_ID=MMETSP0313-20130426/5941_1 /TAXON_ID=2792 /ORGANISM="Porphyridium aerugineum, Strain SAG 1380-2" /LENGTH=456 /DNA_ID=CAMNT_0027158961 /DNA_START=364 /DNA_END=1734 /DNA_ORIENTATION=+
MVRRLRYHHPYSSLWASSLSIRSRLYRCCDFKTVEMIRCEFHKRFAGLEELGLVFFYIVAVLYFGAGYGNDPREKEKQKGSHEKKAAQKDTISFEELSRSIQKASVETDTQQAQHTATAVVKHEHQHEHQHDCCSSPRSNTHPQDDTLISQAFHPYYCNCNNIFLDSNGNNIISSEIAHLKQLFADHCMPEWSRRKYITHGYRPLGQPIKNIIASAFKLHNETGNFWTHFIPGIFFCFVALPYVVVSRLSSESVFDRVLMAIYVLAAASCHSASSMYHLFACRNERTFVALCRADYKAIVSLICASQLPALSVVLLRKSLIWGQVSLAVLVLLWLIGVPLMTHFEKHAMDAQKNALMIVMAGYGSFCIVLASCVFKAINMTTAELVFFASRTCIMYAIYALGFIIFGLRLPERWIPGKVNLWGHSHQLWHICVTAASSVWLVALLQFYEFDSMQRV